MTMMNRPGLDQPIQATEAVQKLLSSIMANCELRVGFCVDFAEVSKLSTRSGKEVSVTPLFDPAASRLNKENCFWLYAVDADDHLLAKQAFRMELVNTSLAEWALGWILGVYLKRGELVVPTNMSPNDNSVSHNLAGCLVYHGELWIDSKFRRREFVELFSKLGLALAYVKWNPDAVWALVGKSMATSGHMSRMGYAHLESGFLNWEFIPDGADKMEWLGVANRRTLNGLIAQIADQTTLMSTGQTSETTVTPF